MWKNLEELARETRKEILQKASREELLELLKAKLRVKGLTADDLLEALSPEQRAALAQRLKEDEASARPEGADLSP